MKPSERTIKRRLKELRAMIDSPSSSAVEVRLAQAAEHAIRWATEDTVGWNSPADECRLLNVLLEEDL